MDWEYLLPVIVMFSTFFIMLGLSVPIIYAIGVASLLSILTLLPFDAAVAVISQKLTIGLNGFTLLAIPFFVLAGNIMNSGGIAKRLITLAKVIVGRLPGSLAHCNILANTLFGAISGSAVASAAAIGGIMSPIQKKEGYDPSFSTAVNIASAPTGLIIPPSNILIVFSLASGGTSIAALFVAGYLPGLLIALALMVVAGYIAKKRNYPIELERPKTKEVAKALFDALPSLFLIFIVIGGIIGGIFTPTEASAIAVLYTFILAVFIYREIKPKDLYGIFLNSVVSSTLVLMLVGVSMGMSWAMSSADVPFLIADALGYFSDNPLVILLIINIILLIVGTFMDMVPAVLIFTPIFLPIANEMGIDTIQFGIMMVFNLCIGLCTPPVGSILFVGCGVGNVSIDKVIKPLLPMYLVMFFVLFLIIAFPAISLTLPAMFSLI